MSEFYEGIVVRCSDEQMGRFFFAVESRLRLHWVQLTPGVEGIYHAGGRRDLFSSDEIDSIAAQVSMRYPCLVVNYENQVGTCEARYYVDGVLARSFGPEDEVWVLLSEDGEPLTDGPRYSVNELREDNEYDCIHSAIDAGLETLGTAGVIDHYRLLDSFCYERLPIKGENLPLA